METIVLNENYEGLIKRHGGFIYEGDLVIGCDLIIDIKLLVEGVIYAEGCIYAKGDISAGLDIYAEGRIYAKGGISAKSGIYAKGDISILGIKTEFIALISGRFTFNILVMDNHIKIGCQLKTKKEWLALLRSDNAEELAKRIGDDGTMWENKRFIENLCVEY